jgi:hypothetical protein
VKIIQYNRGYYVKTSDHEMGILRAMVKYMVWSKDWDKFVDTLSPSQFRALRRRINQGKLLRTDEDRRSGEFVGMTYDEPHSEP